MHDECMKMKEQDSRPIYSSQVSFWNAHII